MFFSAAGLRRAWETLSVDEFPYWSNVPRLMWKDSIPPPPPANVQATMQGNQVMVQWQAPTTDEPLIYNVYRSATTQFSVDDVHSLVFISGRNVTQFVDPSPLKENSFYAVSALDRMGNESELSPITQIQSVAILPVPPVELHEKH